ncbi:MAG: molybdenum cofactor biosynthesis protein MoaE [Acidobacteriia bacterium]|nr:molybdenum cofactor biosynthesis protein MoaE [Terriglobia bacterium]
MRIQVLLFGQLKDIAGRPEETIDLPAGSTLGDLVARYAGLFPKFKALAGSIACSVNQEYAPVSTVLSENDEVGLLPPVSGGMGGTISGRAVVLQRSAHCQIVKTPIAAQPVADALKAPEDGATVVFEGIVRNNTRGRPTRYLDYECYESMAISEMEKLSQQALEQFKVRDIRLIHRLGRMEIGETSVLIVVSSAHRGAAFEACRWVIDMLKKTVPIWKKEYFEDGAVWADGEPFPEDIRASATLGKPTSASKKD